MWTPEAAVPEGTRQRLEALARIDPSRMNNRAFMAAFLEIVSQLKSSERTGWVDRKLPQPESIADHMYRMAVICMLTEDDALDQARCVQIALCHDMAEALVGDITPYDTTCDKTEKHRRELAAMEYMRDIVARFNPRAAQHIYDLWCEYEYQTTREAAFVKDIDKFELMSQADEYTRQHPTIDLSEFKRVRQLVKTPEVKTWVDALDTYDQAVEQ